MALPPVNATPPAVATSNPTNNQNVNTATQTNCLGGLRFRPFNGRSLVPAPIRGFANTIARCMSAARTNLMNTFGITRQNDAAANTRLNTTNTENQMRKADTGPYWAGYKNSVAIDDRAWEKAKLQEGPLTPDDVLVVALLAGPHSEYSSGEALAPNTYDIQNGMQCILRDRELRPLLEKFVEDGHAIDQELVLKPDFKADGNMITVSALIIAQGRFKDLHAHLRNHFIKPQSDTQPVTNDALQVPTTSTEEIESTIDKKRDVNEGGQPDLDTDKIVLTHPAPPLEPVVVHQPFEHTGRVIQRSKVDMMVEDIQRTHTPPPPTQTRPIDIPGRDGNAFANAKRKFDN